MNWSRLPAYLAHRRQQRGLRGFVLQQQWIFGAMLVAKSNPDRFFLYDQITPQNTVCMRATHSSACYAELSILLLMVSVPCAALRRFPQFCSVNLSKVIPSASTDAIDLISKLVAWDPAQRLSSEQALRHPYFVVCIPVRLLILLNSLKCCSTKTGWPPVHCGYLMVVSALDLADSECLDGKELL